MEFDDLIVNLADKFPVLISILSVVGFLRMINKPLFSFLRTFVLATKTDKDDLVLNGIEQSKPYKWFSYLLDWSLSVKIPPKK